MNSDERRSAALLFGEELALGEVTPDALEVAEVEEAVRDRSVPSWLARRYQRRAVARGTLTYEAASVAPMLAARRAVLGERAAGAPRLLLRIEEFPHALQTPEAFRRVHETLRAHEIPYLVVALPHVPSGDGTRYPTTEEIELLAELRRDAGVAFALREDLTAEEPAQLTERLDRAEGALAQHGILPDVFAAPGDRFDARQYRLLAERYAVVTGGPASVDTLGWHPTPLWRGEAVYLPSYAPLHGRARTIAPAVARLIAQDAALWVPVALDWTIQDDDELLELCALLRGVARPWDEFLAAVRASAAAG